jgi:hypothetical protein
LFDRVTLLSNGIGDVAEWLIYACLTIGVACMLIGLGEYFRRRRNKGDDE